MRRPAEPCGAAATTASACGTTAGGPTRLPGAAARAAPSSACGRGAPGRPALQQPGDEDDERGGDEREAAGPLGGERHAAGGPGGEEPARPPAVLHVAEREQDAEHGPRGDEDVEGRDARLRHPERVGGGEEQGEQRPGRREAEPAAERVDAGQQGDAGDHGRQPPAERAVAEQEDAAGDGELAHLRVGPRHLVPGGPAVLPVGAHAAVDDGLAVLGVVDLVEHHLRGGAELPQAERRRDEQDERHRQCVAVAAVGVCDTEWACEHLCVRTSSSVLRVRRQYSESACLCAPALGLCAAS